MKRSLIALASSLALALPLPSWAAGGGGGGGGGGDEISVRDPDNDAAMAAVRKQDWRQVVARMELQEPAGEGRLLRAAGDARLAQ